MTSMKKVTGISTGLKHSQVMTQVNQEQEKKGFFHRQRKSFPGRIDRNISH